MIMPTTLSIMPRMACIPCRLATRACQIPRELSISAKGMKYSDERMPGMHAKLRAPKSRERFAANRPVSWLKTSSENSLAGGNCPPGATVPRYPLLFSW